MTHQESTIMKHLLSTSRAEANHDQKLAEEFVRKYPELSSKMYGSEDVRGGMMPGQDPAAPLGIDNAVYRIWDPRQKINTARHLCIYQGGNNTNVVQIPATGVSNSQLQWNYPVPSNVIVGNEWMAQVNVTFTFTGVGYNGGQLLVFGKYDGVRDLPLHKVTNSITNKMNNQTFTVNPSQYIDALSRYISDHDRNKYFSGTGAMADQFFNYADANSLGSNRNPLAFYGENTKMAPRGSLQYNIMTNTNTSATVNVTIVEPLLISPLMYGRDGDNHSGFPSLQNINLLMQLGDLSRMWSHGYASDNGTISSITGKIESAYLNIVQITPDQNLNPISFDRPYIFNYNNLTAYPNLATEIKADGVPVTLVSGQLQVNAIPSRIYIWARQQDSDRDSTTSDTFAVFKNVSITWDNQNSLLANATSNDLWRMSVKNGLQMSYPQWSTYTGGVLCVELGSDIGLLPNQAPGLTGKYQLSVKGDFFNPSNYAGSSAPATVKYVLYVLPVIPGSAVFQGNTCNIKEGLFESSEEILAANYYAPVYSRHDSVHSSMYGGNFLGDIWDTVKDVGRKIGSVVLPVADKVSGFLAPQYNPIIKGIRGITGLGAPIGGLRHRMYGRGLEFSGDDEQTEQHEQAPQSHQLPNGLKMIGNSYVSPNFNQFANQDYLAQHRQMINTNIPGATMTGMASVNFPSNVSRNNGAAEVQMLQAHAQQAYNNSLSQGPKSLMNSMASERNYAANPELYTQQSTASFQPPYNKYIQGPLRPQQYRPTRVPVQASGGCDDCVGSVSKNELRERLMNPPRGNGLNFEPKDETREEADRRLFEEMGVRQ
jgi:hypothetical protein